MKTMSGETSTNSIRRRIACHGVDKTVFFSTRFILLFSSYVTLCCYGWVVVPPDLSSTSCRKSLTESKHAPVVLFAKKQSRSSSILQPQAQMEIMIGVDDNKKYIDEDAPAGIKGAEFFGGNKEKEEFFDPIAEAEASRLSGITLTSKPEVVTSYIETTNGDGDVDFGDSKNYVIDRFFLEGAFDSATTAAIARDIQMQINSVLYDDVQPDSSKYSAEYRYSKTIQWDTPFPKGPAVNNPLMELEKCLDFYRRIDLAITSGKLEQNKDNESVYNFRFEVAVTWPTFLEPRVLLTGASKITVNISSKEIFKQLDTLDDRNLMMSIVQQLVPRFWDIYHIGMAPSSEVSPRIQLQKKRLFSSYALYQIPSRIFLRPTLQDSSDRANRDSNNAAFIPNHAFSCAIKTMGPLKQRYSATSPVMVQIYTSSRQQQQSSFFELSWEIPLSVEYVSNTFLRLPTPDYDSLIDPDNQNCQYVWHPQRLIATLPFYGGLSPQDESVVDVRKELYQRIIQDGFKPRLDSSGRPQFFFIQNSIKACFTEEGLGMAVYEWRPRFARPNEIGIELVGVDSDVQLEVQK